MVPPVRNLDSLTDSREIRHGDRFEARIFPLSSLLGAQRLGYNLTVVPPGKRAFPFHNHHANEELFFVIEGQGMLRYGDAEVPVRVGDVIACPPGGPETAHQLLNTGESPLRYLAISTAIDTDIFQYPDSGKFGAVGGRKPGQRPLDAPFAGFWSEDGRKEYWDGESGER